MNNNANILSNNQSGVDIFGFNGLAKIVNGILEYRRFKIELTQENKESVYHLVRKDILSSQEKTKKLIDKILQEYQDKKFIASMQLIRILEYLDDDVLGAILNIKILQRADASVTDDIGGEWFLDPTQHIHEDNNARILFRNNLLSSISGMAADNGYYICNEIIQIRNIYNS